MNQTKLIIGFIGLLLLFNLCSAKTWNIKILGHEISITFSLKVREANKRSIEVRVNIFYFLNKGIDK